MTHLQNLSYHQNSNCHSKPRGSPRTRTSTETSGRNCVCVIQFAEEYLRSGSIDQVETSPASIRAEILEIAGLLVENQGNIDEYCIICSMMDLQSANTTINMVQCDHCNRWAHTECTSYSAEELSHDFSFMCKKCKANG
ncbi:hypothetical protein AOXY_G7504 [Acipenser oxyrinchus oxyrinchus]|uniref:PHD-type domain-containing protein n=1 Tax=Acipenser oxyrinchus oxyrinchus TaxID=40147 RepID=A0AAD8LKR1_ACIOX|nr:hypothetical protein AOXY_G7504 [Acipenser oxyrinchus oxyrinchus]